MFNLLLSQNILFLNFGTGSLSKESYLSFRNDLFNIGYKLDPLAKKTICSYSDEEFEKIKNVVISCLTESLSGNKSFKTLLSDFIEDDELFYKENLSCPHTLSFVDSSGLRNMLHSLLSSKTSMTRTFQEIVKSYLKTNEDIIPSSIPLKENIALIAEVIPLERLQTVLNIKTPTDLLRITFSIANKAFQDLSGFKLSNKQRKFVSSVLNTFSYGEDLLRYRREWLVIAKIIHIGANQKKYPQAFALLNQLRNSEKELYSFNREKEKAIKLFKQNDKNLPLLLSLLSKRPGEFANSLDFMLRNTSSPNLVISSFRDIAPKLSSSMLIRLKGLFKTNKSRDVKFFVPKGGIFNIYTKDKFSSKLNDSIFKEINEILDQSLLNLLPQNEEPVFIDEELKNVLIPSALKNASKSSNLLTRGSKITFEPEKLIRLFLWWENYLLDNKEIRTDIDLSVLMYDENFILKENVSYSRLFIEGCYHSGDFVNAPISEGGASEFIDIDLESLCKRYESIRYIAVSLFCYSDVSFNKINCFAGVMNISDPSQLFDLKTVETKFTLDAEERTAIPLVYDIKEKCYIWIDASLKNNLNLYNAENAKGAVANALQYAVSLSENKMSIYDRLLLSHKNIVPKEEASIIFDREYFSKIENLTSLI